MKHEYPDWCYHVPVFKRGKAPKKKKPKKEKQQGVPPQ